MKPVTLMAIAHLLIASSAFAMGSKAPVPSPSPVETINPGDTPFEVMKKLFDGGQPLPFSGFPSATDPSLKSWQCTWATENRSWDQLSPQAQMLVRVKGIDTSDGSTNAREGLLMIPTDGSFEETPEEIFEDLYSYYLISTGPGFSAQYSANPYQKSYFSEIEQDGRQMNGAILIKETIFDPDLDPNAPNPDIVIDQQFCDASGAPLYAPYGYTPGFGDGFGYYNDGCEGKFDGLIKYTYCWKGASNQALPQQLDPYGL